MDTQTQWQRIPLTQWKIARERTFTLIKIIDRLDTNSKRQKRNLPIKICNTHFNYAMRAICLSARFQTIVSKYPNKTAILCLNSMRLQTSKKERIVQEVKWKNKGRYATATYILDRLFVCFVIVDAQNEKNRFLRMRIYANRTHTQSRKAPTKKKQERKQPFPFLFTRLLFFSYLLGAKIG